MLKFLIQPLPYRSSEFLLKKKFCTGEKRKILSHGIRDSSFKTYFEA